MAKLKRIARFLVGQTRRVWIFDWQLRPCALKVFVDADVAGCQRTRKSIVGGAEMLGKHTVKTWSSSQGAFALSSAEAELYAMIEGVTRAKGLLSLARDLGFKDVSNVVRLGTDSSAAKSFVSRRGLGKMGHLEIRDLWLQKEIATES